MHLNCGHVFLFDRYVGLLIIKCIVSLAASSNTVVYMIYYIIANFGRVDLVTELVDHIRNSFIFSYIRVISFFMAICALRIFAPILVVISPLIAL